MPYASIKIASTNVVYKDASGTTSTIPLANKVYCNVINGVVTLRMTTQLIVEPLYNLLIGTNTAPITGDKAAAEALDTLLAVTLPEYADNAAALLAGLTTGMLYRTVDAVKIVH